VAPKHRCRELALLASLLSTIVLGASLAGATLATGCSWLPPDSPASPPAVDPDSALLHPWRITDHVLGPHALISDHDAAGFHGRTIAITATSYSSPWSGSCSEAARDRAQRLLADITAEHDLARDRAIRLGLADPMIEYRLTCGLGRTLPLTFYVAGAHALTCWSGVCYLLAR
jgi:hypothetical protein